MFLFIIIVLGIIICSLNQSIEKDKNELGILYQEFSAKYLGGLPYVYGVKKVDIKVYKETFCLDIKGYKKVCFDKSNINNVEIIKHNQVVDEINIGKVEVFGYFALGMQDKKTIIKKYVAVTINDESLNRYVIIESKSANQLVNVMQKDF